MLQYQVYENNMDYKQCTSCINFTIMNITIDSDMDILANQVPSKVDHKQPLIACNGMDLLHFMFSIMSGRLVGTTYNEHAGA